jgi:hypothetical protein
MNITTQTSFTNVFQVIVVVVAAAIALNMFILEFTIAIIKRITMTGVRVDKSHLQTLKH